MHDIYKHIYLLHVATFLKSLFGKRMRITESTSDPEVNILFYFRGGGKKNKSFCLFEKSKQIRK